MNETLLNDATSALTRARERTLALVEPVRSQHLDCVHSPLMSPLAWDLGHIAAFEDLWIAHRYGGRKMVRPQLAQVYDAFETPRAQRGELRYLHSSEVFLYLQEVREHTLEILAELEGERDAQFFLDLVLHHERQHNETMLQTLALAQLDYYQLKEPNNQPPASGCCDESFIEYDGGDFLLGTSQPDFCYDNERPEHSYTLAPFALRNSMVTNGEYLEFVLADGYQQKEYWSQAGWQWLQTTQVERPLYWSSDNSHEWQIGGYKPLDLNRPVAHISYFEAEAFARSRNARLPSEQEWEFAATWNDRQKQRYPWGSTPPTAEVANLGQRACQPYPAGSYPQGQTAHGCFSLIGDLWEWTVSDFHGYPGFESYPYPEYSQVFFGPTYKVLRGGSWASANHVIRSTFRNWDFPQRRQIFVGFRLTKDLSGR